MMEKKLFDVSMLDFASRQNQLLDGRISFQMVDLVSRGLNQLLDKEIVFQMMENIP